MSSFRGWVQRKTPCPTCSGSNIRETTNMVCQTCGMDYSTDPPKLSMDWVLTNPLLDPPPTCQHCLADPRYTPVAPRDYGGKCPVCGSAYSGPRRSKEYVTLLEAGLVAKGD
jgi:hypothetical protein